MVEKSSVVLTIFTAGERDYIALLPMEGAEAGRGRGLLYTVIPSQRMDSRIWRILKMMTNMRS